MEFRDLKTQYRKLQPEMDQAISEVLCHTNFISGRQVQELEEQLAEYVGVKHCITCGNGTDALTLALMAWNIGENDAVFVPDFTFFASGEVVSYAGATPVFVDVCEETFNISADSLEAAVKRVTEDGTLAPKAVVAVDLFGQPADYQRLRKITEKYGLLLLEDGAQGFGGSICGKRACSFGDIAATSFFPAKPLGCYGDGGAVFTDDDGVNEYLRSVCVHGKGSFKYDNVRIGMNSRLDTIQAAILQVKLQAFREYELDAVNRISEEYKKELQGAVQIPAVKEGFLSSWAQYTIKLEDSAQRDEMKNKLQEQGIPSMIYYPKPLHRQEAFGGLTEYVKCPVTEKLCGTVLSLPMHPYLQQEEVKAITGMICNIVQKGSRE